MSDNWITSPAMRVREMETIDYRDVVRMSLTPGYDLTPAWLRKRLVGGDADGLVATTLDGEVIAAMIYVRLSSGFNVTHIMTDQAECWSESFEYLIDALISRCDEKYRSILMSVNFDWMKQFLRRMGFRNWDSPQFSYLEWRLSMPKKISQSDRGAIYLGFMK